MRTFAQQVACGCLLSLIAVYFVAGVLIVHSLQHTLAQRDSSSKPRARSANRSAATPCTDCLTIGSAGSHAHHTPHAHNHTGTDKHAHPVRAASTNHTKSP